MGDTTKHANIALENLKGALGELENSNGASREKGSRVRHKVRLDVKILKLFCLEVTVEHIFYLLDVALGFGRITLEV